MLIQRRYYLVILSGILVVLTTAGIFSHNRYPKNPPPEKSRAAFLNALWGMSQMEVERSNGRKLYPVKSYRKFYTVKTGVLNKERYRAMQEEKGRLIFGRASEIIYVFFDDHLFSYHVFIRDREPSGIDRDMRSYLIKRYGYSFSPGKENEPLVMVWNHRDVNVNYWFYKDVLSLGEKYTAGYGVVYRPIEESISG